MTLKNWPRGFAGACAISLLARAAVAQPAAVPGAASVPHAAQAAPPAPQASPAAAPQPSPAAPHPTPAIALIDAADAVQWQNWTRELGWQVLAADGAPDKNIDLRVLALAAKVEAGIKSGSVDATRVYLVGRGDAAAARGEWRGGVADALTVGLDGAQLIVDALFGAGLSRPIEGEAAALIARVNEARRQGARVIAVDLPSGINGASGAVNGALVFMR